MCRLQLMLRILEYGLPVIFSVLGSEASTLSPSAFILVLIILTGIRLGPQHYHH
ncbi:hypothetical protein DICPUDRAFT_151986 [Dictyostelium purpureum]|uniref:Uncharacterized protein n=1 Tax=Dictyostelium purpureum TaxID=5786 RepID=F0ZK75_DICPU|nr:uncharacterized protein DICPUDRAFT_151986 [Dictyostelium purpureum]EGC35637.1 hypothetical protein DICPUDRAFT_151986 [Dictyostelium purpureum]|eukprot:XP_003287816.1 hypothetical protein DICPUDRAFT_151986 [Dictyostelium purpureum]